MATVVNNPGTTHEGNGFGFLLGVLLLIAFAVIVLFYGLPYIGNSFGNAGGNSGAVAPQVQIPDKVNVNLNQQPK